eukprot:5586192-Pyramimonas_sp.AAC.1
MHYSLACYAGTGEQLGHNVGRMIETCVVDDAHVEGAVWQGRVEDEAEGDDADAAMTVMSPPFTALPR